MSTQKSWAERREEFSAMSKDDLLDIIKGFYENPNKNIYFALKAKIDQTALEVAAANIKIGTREFEQFLKYGKDIAGIAESLMRIKMTMEPELIKEIEEKINKPDDGSLEAQLQRWMEDDKTGA